MSCLSTTWSPNSFQLRLAFNGRRSPVVFVRTRFPKLDRRIRTFSVAADSKQNGNAAEKPGNTWTNSNSSGDGLSGWSGADANEQSDDARGNSWSGGIVGAGIAGVILLAGLTFATLSLNKRSNSSLKQQMKPFTEQQETSLTFDDQDARVEEENAEGKYETRETSDLESRTGTYNSYAEKNEATTENSPDDEKNMVNLSTDDDVDNKASIQQDLHNDSAIGDISVAPEATPELPKSNTSGVSFVPSSSDDLDGVVVAETFEVKSESKENLLDSSVYNAHPTSELKEIEDSGFSLDSSSNSITHVSSEPLVTMDSQFDAVVEPKVVIEENIGIVSSVPTEDLGPRKTKDTFAKGNDSALEMDNLNGSASAGTTMVSAVANPFANEVDESSIDINESRSFLDSMNSGNLFTSAGIPAPSVVSAALQALPGKVLVPAVVDQVQGQALAALQVLKVIEADVQPGDLCSRREYARWLVAASSALSRNTVSKVYPAMYIENVTELAFDDITPEDPDFPSIQGLAEAGLISSKLSRHDMHSSLDEEGSPLRFSPEIPLSRQDLVSWKMALEKRQLPVADRKMLQQLSGFIDIDKINPDAWPALVADLSAGEQGITALAFGYTRLFQPDKPVTNAQAAIALATGEGSDIVSEELARIEAESMAEKAVTAHNALIAEVEKDVNANFEKELLLEREKIEAVEKLAEAARQELERLRIEREEENTSLMKERAAVEAEMEVLSRLRREVEEQLQTLMSNKVEISYEKERLNKLMKDAEIENQEIVRLQRELEVERKALSMARAWAEDEAKRAREQAKSLEEARDRWERKGLKVIVDQDLQEEANAGVTWLDAGKQFEIEGTVNRAENLVDTLKALAADVGGKSRDTIHKIIHKILSLIAILKEWAIKAGGQAMELKETASSKIGDSLQELQKGSVEFGSSVKEGAKRVAGDCREGVEKLTQKFKT